MKIETREIYKCDYCNKLYQIKNRCADHEKVCSKNPKNDRPCFGCRYLSTKKHTYYIEQYDWEEKRTVELMYCEKVATFIYPPKVEHKNNWIETEEPENRPMPKNCDHYDNFCSVIDEFFN